MKSGSRRQAGVNSARLGVRVKQLRLERGLSQEDLAGASDIHVTYLSSLERGARNPSLNVMAAIARGLGVALTDLVDGLQ